MYKLLCFVLPGCAATAQHALKTQLVRVRKDNRDLRVHTCAESSQNQDGTHRRLRYPHMSQGFTLRPHTCCARVEQTTEDHNHIKMCWSQTCVYMHLTTDSSASAALACLRATARKRAKHTSADKSVLKAKHSWARALRCDDIFVRPLPCVLALAPRLEGVQKKGTGGRIRCQSEALLSKSASF